MALEDQIGLSGPKYEVDIERGKIREFARAMSAPLPDFNEGRNPVIPATFLVNAPYTWGYTLERPRGTALAQIDHDLSVSLHAGEQFTFHGSLPRAGDRLIARGQLESVQRKSGAQGGELTFLTFLTAYHAPDGTLRAEQRSISVTTAQAPGSGGWQADIPDYVPDYRNLETASPFAGIARAGWNDMLEGATPDHVATPPLSMQEIVRFQGVVGEDDPLHHDPAWAKANDYPSVFALGTHQASLLAAYAAHWLDPCKVRDFRIRFHNIAWPGDRLIYGGRVASLDTQSRRAALHLTCTRGDGTIICDARSTLDFTNTGDQP